MMGDFGWGYGNMMGWGGFGLGMISMVIFWALVIWLIVVLVRGSSWYSHEHHRCYEPKDAEHKNFEEKKEDRALAILRERYAKGDISKEEFEERKKALSV